MKAFKQILAVMEKELKLDFRFKLDFVMQNMMQPFKLLILFFFIYSGFYYAGAKNIGMVSSENYIIFLILGAIFYSFFYNSFNMLSVRFIEEKYWQTVQGMLIAPISKLNYLIGYGLAKLIGLFVIFLPLFIILYITNPIGAMNLIFVILILIISYLGVLGMGLILGAFSLSKENFQFLAIYFFLFWTFFSCFYYPIEALPKFLHPFVLVNPVYYANVIVKSIWMNGSYNIFGFVYLIIFSLISISIGILVFNKFLKKWGIEGY